VYLASSPTIARLLQAVGMVAMTCAALFSPQRGVTDEPSTNVRVSELSKPAIVTAAKEWFFAFRSGNVDRSKLSGTVNYELSQAMMRAEMNTLRSLGKPTSFTYLRVEPFGGLAGYEVVVSFARTERQVIEGIAFDADGQLAGIDFEIVSPKVPRAP